MPREPDELGLRPAEVVILLGKEHGEEQCTPRHTAPHLRLGYVEQLIQQPYMEYDVYQR